MGQNRKITRRDFMNGIALGVIGGSILSPLEAVARLGTDFGSGEYYPPRLTGMRGSHAGSFEVAHGVAREGVRWGRPEEQTDDTYDLIVVGGGISGLSAAWFYRQQAGARAKILILDNHDDFGGHAKRNEFDVDGTQLIGYGGSIGIEGPSSYSDVAKQLLKDLAIDVRRFHDYYDQGFYARWGLEGGIYFRENKYGADLVTPDPFEDTYQPASGESASAVINRFPVSRETKDALTSLLRNETDLVGEMEATAKLTLLDSISYSDYLSKYANVPPEGVEILRDKTSKLVWAIGWDRMSALEAARFGMPGTGNWGLSDEQVGVYAGGEPFIHLFPDGNASIARLLVRSLRPDIIPGSTMEDIVTARVDYSRLDVDGANVRIRLNSTAVDVRHTGDRNEVDVTYVKDGAPYRVRGKHTVLACYNRIIPHICPEVPEAQAEAISHGVKVPLVYIKMAFRNWRPWAEAGVSRLYIPKADLSHYMRLDYPVSMGEYQYSPGPEHPAVIHAVCNPTTPDQGLTAREQHILGRQKLFELSFDDFESDVSGILDGAFSSHGMDIERDLAAITVNRWSHGYAYEYSDVSDPIEYGVEAGPHIAGRAQIGRISIANSDSNASAYADSAIDAAARAVDEQVALD